MNGGGSDLSGAVTDLGLDLSRYVTFYYSAAEAWMFFCGRVHHMPLSGLHPSAFIGFLSNTGSIFGTELQWYVTLALLHH